MRHLENPQLTIRCSLADFLYGPNDVRDYRERPGFSHSKVDFEKANSQSSDIAILPDEVTPIVNIIDTSPDRHPTCLNDVRATDIARFPFDKISMGDFVIVGVKKNNSTPPTVSIHSKSLYFSERFDFPQ